MAARQEPRADGAGLFGIGIGVRLGIVAAVAVMLWAAVAWAIAG
jgi:hypothetical protein